MFAHLCASMLLYRKLWEEVFHMYLAQCSGLVNHYTVVVVLQCSGLVVP